MAIWDLKKIALIIYTHVSVITFLKETHHEAYLEEGKGAKSPLAGPAGFYRPEQPEVPHRGKKE